MNGNCQTGILFESISLGLYCRITLIVIIICNGQQLYSRYNTITSYIKIICQHRFDSLFKIITIIIFICIRIQYYNFTCLERVFKAGEKLKLILSFNEDKYNDKDGQVND